MQKTFGEQLIEARKAKGMTQEALASAAAVTRQTISSWERGRTLPDIDSVNRLSSILDVDFTLKTGKQDSGTDLDTSTNEVPTSDSDAQSEMSALPAKAPHRIKLPWIIAGAAVLLCIVLVCLLLIPRKAPSGKGSTFNVETYLQETPNESDKAYITVDHKTWIATNGGNEYQMYDLTMTEKNGIGFSVSRVEVQLDGVNGPTRGMTVTAEDIAQATDPNIPPYGSITIDGGFPKGEFVRIGVVVYGQDANGEPQAFYHLIEI